MSDDVTSQKLLVEARRSRVQRRTVLGAAAWSAPVIVVAGAAPAFAASGDVLARISPAENFSVNQNTTTQALTVSLSNGGTPIDGRDILFEVVGGAPAWITFSPGNGATATVPTAGGVATATLQFGTPKPAAGTTYTIRASDPTDPGLVVEWTLTYTPVAVTAFTTNFNSIASGTPTALVVNNGRTFSLRVGATTTALGTVATAAQYASTPTAWNNNTGNFKNVASATGSAGSDPGSTATNRAIAFKQSGGFGDPGDTSPDPAATFAVELGVTTGRTDVVAQFLLQSVDTGAGITRTTPVIIDAVEATSAGVVTARRTATVTTGDGQPLSLTNAFRNTLVTANFGDQLSALTGNVFFRIYAGASSGSGSRPTVAVDDLTITWL